jgi:hypothetical protein
MEKQLAREKAYSYTVLPLGKLTLYQMWANVVMFK